MLLCGGEMVYFMLNLPHTCHFSRLALLKIVILLVLCSTFWMMTFWCYAAWTTDLIMAQTG